MYTLFTSSIQNCFRCTFSNIKNYLHYTLCQYSDLFALYFLLILRIICSVLTLRICFFLFFAEIKNCLYSVFCLNEECFALYFLPKLRIVCSLFSDNINNCFCAECSGNIKIFSNWTFFQHYELLVLYFLLVLGMLFSIISIDINNILHWNFLQTLRIVCTQCSVGMKNGFHFTFC